MKEISHAELLKNALKVDAAIAASPAADEDLLLPHTAKRGLLELEEEKKPEGKKPAGNMKANLKAVNPGEVPALEVTTVPALPTTAPVWVP